jgi:hypothetical protein
MTHKIRLLNTMTYLVIFFGTSSIGYWLIMLLMGNGSAESRSLALKGLAAGAAIAIIGILARLIFKPGRQRAQ